MTDTNQPIDTATAIDADIRDADTVIQDTATVTATVTMVTAEDAADMADVSVRTIRRWMQQGHLPYVDSERGKLVSPADLPTAKQRAAHGRDIRRSQPVRGHGHGHDTADTDAATDTVMLSYAATAQMEAIRDQWLRPLVDRIEELSRENGRLEQERDTLRQRVVDLEQRAMAPDPPAAPGDDTPDTPVPGTAAATPKDTRPLWKRLLGVT